MWNSPVYLLACELGPKINPILGMDAQVIIRTKFGDHSFDLFCYNAKRHTVKKQKDNQTYADADICSAVTVYR